MSIGNANLTSIVCWSRMQAEAGQDIRAIIARKELERKAGDGIFFWGIGNAPSRSIGSLLANGDVVDVVFSLMKTRPKAKDLRPSAVIIWTTYFDAHGTEHPIPPHVLVTSRARDNAEPKRSHYALMCRRDEELRIDNQGAFDHLAYRNIGDGGGPVGSSQVTALLKRTRPESPDAGYQINLRAKLVGSYWVRLGRPTVLGDAARVALSIVCEQNEKMTSDQWMEVVGQIRPVSPLAVVSLF